MDAGAADDMEDGEGASESKGDGDYAGLAVAGGRNVQWARAFHDKMVGVIPAWPSAVSVPFGSHVVVLRYVHVMGCGVWRGEVRSGAVQRVLRFAGRQLQAHCGGSLLPRLPGAHRLLLWQPSFPQVMCHEITSFCGDCQTLMSCTRLLNATGVCVGVYMCVGVSVWQVPPVSPRQDGPEDLLRFSQCRQRGACVVCMLL